jgi:hypothetical protein
MSTDETEADPEASYDRITSGVPKDAGLTPDILNLIFGIAVASLLPQAELIKKLIEKNLITKDEVANIYENLLNSSKFPPSVNDLVRPIWAQTAEAIWKGGH